MNANKKTIPVLDPEKLLARIDYLEENRRFIQNVLEMAISLVDFQENIINSYGPENILEETEKRIRQVIPFSFSALYVVDQDSSDFSLAVCNPPDARSFIAAEVEDMIEKGFFAWAIRERRGISITSRDGSKRMVLHVIATHSRIRGMCIGVLDSRRQQIPDSSLTLLSIILLNTANAIESLEFYRLLRQQNTILEKRVEERTRALAESERQMQQVLKLQAIGTLAGGIAHDFNNILFPIIGYTELTMDDVSPESQAFRNLEEVLKAANRAKELVQQILTFSRLNGHSRKPIRVQTIIHEALKLLRASIPKTIDIRVDVDDSCMAILGDATQIHQVVMNLCTNAYQAMLETGGRIEIGLRQVDIDYDETVHQVGIKMGPHVMLTIKDEGIGMEPLVLERIFEPYYTTKEPGKGTGLGLSVIHGIVKNHSGFIRVESTPARGSTFRVYLPVLEDAGPEVDEAVSSPEPGCGERILLVDDEEQIVAVGRQMLEKLGYHVTARTDSLDALALFAQGPENFDLVITDMTMPRMSGDQMARKLLEIKPTLPIILCTGYSEMITEVKAEDLGIVKFVMKPIIKEDLAIAVRAALEAKGLAAARPQPAPEKD
jgi:signal transduction histidine kinase/ActR/RegA family two-component response regulator